MRGILKALFGWLLPRKPASKPVEEPRKIKVVIFAPLAIMDGMVVCSRCGAPLPRPLCFPGVVKPYAEGMLAAGHDFGQGANPYWQTKDCFAIAAWNLGWLHATACGNKKEPACST